MEINKSDVIEKAAKLIMNVGIEALTIENLTLELGVKENQINNQFAKDDDIVLMLLLNFETELKELIQEFSTKSLPPETELKLLFNKLYKLFLQKPFYLSIIFDKNLYERENAIKLSIIRIKNSAQAYLTTIINEGKMQHTFQTKVPTRLIVGKLLSEFRLLMKDEQRVNEMILELKTIKNT